MPAASRAPRTARPSRPLTARTARAESSKSPPSSSPSPVNSWRAWRPSAPRGELPTTTPSANGHFASRLKVPEWLSDRGVTFTRKEQPMADGRTVYLLAECPFDPSHGRTNEVCVMQDADGKLSARCLHNGCRPGWRDFQARSEPPSRTTTTRRCARRVSKGKAVSAGPRWG